MSVDMRKPEFRLAHTIRQTELAKSQHVAAVRDGLVTDTPSVIPHMDGEIRGLRSALAILVGERDAVRILSEYDGTPA